jgi:hypothetical protein
MRRSSDMKCIWVHKNTFCTNISVPRSLKNFLVIRNFHILWKYLFSVRNWYIHDETRNRTKTYKTNISQTKLRRWATQTILKTAVEPLIHENTNKSQTCLWIHVVYGYFLTLSKEFVNVNNKSNRPVWWCHVPRENQATDKHYHTTIPHSKLKDRLRDLVQLCFIKKNGQRRYKYSLTCLTGHLK